MTVKQTAERCSIEQQINAGDVKYFLCMPMMLIPMAMGPNAAPASPKQSAGCKNAEKPW